MRPRHLRQIAHGRKAVFVLRLPADGEPLPDRAAGLHARGEVEKGGTVRGRFFAPRHEELNAYLLSLRRLRHGTSHAEQKERLPSSCSDERPTDDSVRAHRWLQAVQTACGSSSLASRRSAFSSAPMARSNPSWRFTPEQRTHHLQALHPVGIQAV